MQKNLSDRVYFMPRAELRGYIRAKTTTLVQGEMTRLLREEPNLAVAQQTKLATDLTDRVVLLVQSDIVHARSQHVAGHHLPARKAA